MTNNQHAVEIPTLGGSSSSSSESTNKSRKQAPYPKDPGVSQASESERPTSYEFVDSQELARRLSLPPSWIRDQVRARSQDPLPHVNFGRYVRFLWPPRASGRSHPRAWGQSHVW